MKYKLLELDFKWTWIRDKQIHIDGDRFRGLIIISDKDDNVVQILGYELVEEDNKEE